MFPYLTDEDIQFLEEDERRYVQEFLKKYEPKKNAKTNSHFRYKSKPVFATAVSKSSVQSEAEKKLLDYLRQRMRDADPIARQKFMDKVEGVEF